MLHFVSSNVIPVFILCISRLKNALIAMIYVLFAHYLSFPAQLYSTKLFNSFMVFFNIQDLFANSFSYL